MNKVILSGRITNELEIKIANEKEILSFGLAVQRDKEKTDFINITAFGKTAEIVANNCNKGDKIMLEGSIRQSTFKDKDGNNRVNYSVIMERLEFIDSRKKTETKPDQTKMEGAKEIQYTAEDLPFELPY